MLQSAAMQPLTPINNIESETLSVNLPLPSYAQPERIGVNVPLIEKMARFAGMSHLTIGTFREKDEVSTTAQNVGENMASAVGIKTRVASRTRTRLMLENKRRFKLCQWSDAYLDVNLEKLEEDLKASKKGVASHESWIHLLNKYIQNGLNETGTKHLLTIDGFQLAGDVVTMGSGLFFGVNMTIAWIVTAAARTATAIGISQNPGEPPVRISCSLGGFEFDRALIFKAMMFKNRDNFVRGIL